MLRLFFLIKSQPELVNQKFPMFNGSERSFADLSYEDGQNVKSEKVVKDSIRLFRNIDPAFLDNADDVRLMKQIFHKIRINAHGITADAITGSIAHGISMAASALNHSCHPNTGLIFKGSIPQLRAMRDIVVGEELTVSHVDNKLPKAERQKLLISRGFICKCERCEAGDPPDELDAAKFRWLAGYLNSLTTISAAEKRVLRFDTMTRELVAREKQEGPFSPGLTNDMMQAVRERLLSKASISELDQGMMLTLMKKIMTAWPITHGTDHRQYPDVLKLNEEVNRKFGKKK